MAAVSGSVQESCFAGIHPYNLRSMHDINFGIPVRIKGPNDYKGDEKFQAYSP